MLGGGRAEQSRAGQGRAGQGRAGQHRAGQDRCWQGTGAIIILFDTLHQPYTHFYIFIKIHVLDWATQLWCVKGQP